MWVGSGGGGDSSDDAFIMPVCLPNNISKYKQLVKTLLKQLVGYMVIE